MRVVSYPDHPSPTLVPHVGILQDEFRPKDQKRSPQPSELAILVSQKKDRTDASSGIQEPWKRLEISIQLVPAEADTGNDDAQSLRCKDLRSQRAFGSFFAKYSLVDTKGATRARRALLFMCRFHAVIST